MCLTAHHTAIETCIETCGPDVGMGVRVQVYIRAIRANSKNDRFLLGASGLYNPKTCPQPGTNCKARALNCQAADSRMQQGAGLD